MENLNPLLASILSAALAALAALAAAAAWRAQRHARAATLEQAESLGRLINDGFARLQAANERLERELRQALETSASSARIELNHRLEQLGGGLGNQLTTQLSALQGGNEARLEQVRAMVEERLRDGMVQSEAALRQLRETLDQRLGALQLGNEGRLAEMRSTLEQRLGTLQQGNETGLGQMRETLEQRLSAMQVGNESRLEQMRATVEEKLQSTLETRLGESFRLVSERLEQVHQGLGEMQTLASGVGDLRRVLGNVKVRGTFGEAQLGMLLDQVLLPDQYAANCVTRPGTSERVDFAIRLPGAGDGQPLLLPVDAKFPAEDYERLELAREAGDAEAAEEAARALERRVRLEAKRIREKYVEPPHTTDFAILFVPAESLFAEVIRRPGLVEALNREHRVVLAGPTTFFAMLNSLQMGFRTLAIEQRSAEVWRLLGAVKTEFSRFGVWVEKVKDQVQSVSRTLEAADTRTRQMQRALRNVEELPATQATQLLPPEEDEGT